MAESEKNFVYYKTKFLYAFLVFSTAVTGRIFYLVNFRENPFFNYYPRGFDQHIILQSTIEIAKGNILGPWSSEKQSAIYKYFLAIPLALGKENFYVVWSWQFLIGALTAVLVYLTGQRIFGRIAGFIAGLWYALYGPAIFFEGQILRESFFCFLLVLLTYLATYVEDKKESTPEDKKTKWCLLASIASVSSFAMQTRPTAAIVFPVIIFYLWFFGLKTFEKRKKIKAIFFTVVVFISVSLPLLIRSIWVHHKFVFYDLSGPFVFFLSNLPDYGGVGWEPSPLYRTFIEKVNGENALTWKMAITRLVELWTLFPLSIATLYLKKLYFFFNGYEYPSNLNYYLFVDYSPLFRMPWSNLSVLSAFGFCGMTLGFKDKKTRHSKTVIYLLFGGVFLSNLIFYPVDRFRLFHTPFLMLFGSYALTMCIKFFMERRIILFLASVIFISAMIWALKIPHHFDGLIRPEDYRNLGLTYLENKSRQNIKKGEYFLYKAWEEWAKRGIPKNPAGEELGKLELLIAKEKIKNGDYIGAVCNIKIAELIWENQEVKMIKETFETNGIELEKFPLSNCIQHLK